ncbi:YhjD/YihY/BrkB family envelope integrity protein [Sulfitobacter pontiacus]|nr:YhjD/YihY/BrkB family envelope integrity protein [Sulfitobacter pontiacus]
MNAKSTLHSGREIVMAHGVLSQNPEVLFYGKGWRVMPAVLYEAILRLWNDNAFGLAGNVAFRALLALFPIQFFASAMTAFIGDRAMADHLVDFLIAIVPSPLIEPLVSEVEKVMMVPRGGVLSIGILLMIWFAVGALTVYEWVSTAPTEFAKPDQLLCSLDCRSPWSFSPVWFW